MDYSVSCVATEKAKLELSSCQARTPCFRHLKSSFPLKTILILQPHATTITQLLWPSLCEELRCETWFVPVPLKFSKGQVEHPLIFSEVHLLLSSCQILGGQEGLLTLSRTAQVTFQAFLRAVCIPSSDICQGQLQAGLFFSPSTDSSTKFCSFRISALAITTKLHLHRWLHSLASLACFCTCFPVFRQDCVWIRV